MTLVRDLDKPQYTLIQVDIEVNSILESVGLESQQWGFLFVELEDNQAEYKRIWGSDSCHLDAAADLIYTTQFNKVTN